MALAEVYEVATFYAHFDVVKEGETPPPAITVRVCNSLSCAMAGAEKLLAELQGEIRRGCARHSRALHGRLRRARRWSRSAMCRPFKRDADKIDTAVKAHEHAHAATPGKSFDIYRSDGGYALLKSCLDGKRTREEMIKAVDDSGLRGLGGAGFPDRTQMDLRARAKRARA